TLALPPHRVPLPGTYRAPAASWREGPVRDVLSPRSRSLGAPRMSPGALPTAGPTRIPCPLPTCAPIRAPSPDHRNPAPAGLVPPLTPGPIAWIPGAWRTP